MGDIFYNKTVTVYNRSVEGLMEKETWCPTVLKDVRLLITKGENVSKSGMESADSAKLFIKTNNLSKEYKKPLEWQNLSTEDKAKTFTLASGADFFVEGDTTAEVPTESDFFSHMKEKYDNCFKVTDVDVFELIPHLEVGGA